MFFAIALVSGVVSSPAVGQTNSDSTQPKEASPAPRIDTSVISTLGDEYQNSIELLKNRFRVDYGVEEVTMIFFRKFGSAPVVLVRPDGSKIFQSQADDDKVTWFDDANFDMVRIKKPVPGPWQAVGQILPDSRIMVLSDLELHAEPLPSILFSGEILKQTAYLTNDGAPIDYSQFRDVVELSLEFKSTNNPNYDNFGSTDEVVATFEDNGRGMDERPMDGTFTGQFNLTIPSGEWQPVFSVVTPMFSREQVNPVLMLHPNPVKLDVKLDDGQEGYHQLLIDVVREQVDIKSLLVDGKVRFPNGDIQNFSITEPSDEPRVHRILAYEDGLFRIKITAYGTTVDGRDIILDVPEFTFLGKVEEEEPDEVAPAQDMPNSIDGTAETPASNLEQYAPAEVAEEEKMDNATLIMFLGIVNGSIIVIGGLVIAVVLMKRKKQAKAQPAPTQENEGRERKGGLFSWIPSFGKKKDT